MSILNPRSTPKEDIIYENNRPLLTSTSSSLDIESPGRLEQPTRFPKSQKSQGEEIKIRYNNKNHHNTAVDGKDNVNALDFHRCSKQRLQTHAGIIKPTQPGNKTGRYNTEREKD